MLNQAIILLFIISFLDFVLGLYVLLNDPKKQVNRSFALFSAAVLIWINASFFQDEATNIGFQAALLKLDFVAGIFAAFFLLLFSLDVSRFEVAQSRLFRFSVIAVSAIISGLILFTNTILAGHVMIQGVITPVYGSAHTLYDILVGAAILSAIGALAWKYKKSQTEERAKFVYLLIGFAISGAIAFTTNILLVSYIENSQHYELYSRLGSFGVIFTILFSGYAIARHKLLNLKVLTTELLSLGILALSLFQALQAQSYLGLAINGGAFGVLLSFVVMLVRDVENEVKRKEELQRMAETLSVTNDKLVELDKARAEFMSIASHQIQTPLTAIRGYISLILEDPQKELRTDYEEMLKKVIVSSDRIIQLIHDFLNISRIESGKMEFTFTECHLEDICQEVVDTLAIKANERRLFLRYEKPGEPLPVVMIDGPKVREVISNLVDNAVKYTPEGGVDLRLELRKKTDSEQTDWIRVTVTDTGIGIPETELPYLFAKFSRGKDKSRLNAGGTGLGLYVGKVMIENNGGKIWAESDGDGKGSRFIVEIPVSR